MISQRPPRTQILNRKSIRKKGHDYASPAYYFLTIMVNDGERLFGKIENGKVILSEAGQIIGKHWKKVPVVYPNTSLDEFVVMPDHFHAILQIKTRVERVTVGNILKSFKSFSAQDANALLGRQGNRLWQRNYYDRILKTPKDVEQIRWYIRQNPAKWDSERRLTAEI